MSTLLPADSSLAAFVAASLVLAITPGPGVLYIVTRTLAQGTARGLLSVLGVAVGNLGNACAAALGLAALLAISELAFALLQYAGAAYLIYLGLRSAYAPDTAATRITSARQALWNTVVDGVWVALLNPKTTLFFAAFLPQFLAADRNSVSANLSLGALFVLIAAVTDAGYALAAGRLAPWLQRPGFKGVARYLSAGVFIGLGLLTAAAGIWRN